MSYNQRGFLSFICLLIVTFNVEYPLASSAHTHIPTISSISFIGLFLRGIKKPKHSKHSNSKQLSPNSSLSEKYPNIPPSYLLMSPKEIMARSKKLNDGRLYLPYTRDVLTRSGTPSGILNSHRHPNIHSIDTIYRYPYNSYTKIMHPIDTRYQYPYNLHTNWYQYSHTSITETLPWSETLHGLQRPNMRSIDTIFWYRCPDIPRNEPSHKKLVKNLEFNVPTTIEKPVCSPAKIRNDYRSVFKKDSHCYIGIEAIKPVEYGQINYSKRRVYKRSAIHP